jgi:hypothetical protein
MYFHGPSRSLTCGRPKSVKKRAMCGLRSRQRTSCCVFGHVEPKQREQRGRPRAGLNRREVPNFPDRIVREVHASRAREGRAADADQCARPVADRRRGDFFGRWLRRAASRYKRTMESRILIDAIVRQTTLLIAQLATSAGLRAPLANLADQVFLELAREIEQQGVTRKVAADMFGMALRSYRRKVSRLRESVSVSEKTLWQAVLEHISEHGTRTRSQLLEAFKRDDEADVIAVLGDLVASGLLYATGRGRSAAYGTTSRADQDALTAERTLETLTHLLWLALVEPPGLTRAEIGQQFGDAPALVDAALEGLLSDRRAERDDSGAEPRFFSKRVMIPVGSEAGWETAVFDHFRAVCTALVNKLRLGGASAAAQALIGGTTLSFELSPNHPHEQEVKGLLTRVRAEALELWQRVAAYNAQHRPAEDTMERVIFYAGQNFIAQDANGTGQP